MVTGRPRAHEEVTVTVERSKAAGDIIAYFRSLSTEQKAFFALANKEVGLEATLGLLSEQVGLSGEMRETERVALRELALARNVQIKI